MELKFVDNKLKSKAPSYRFSQSFIRLIRSVFNEVLPYGNVRAYYSFYALIYSDLENIVKQYGIVHSPYLKSGSGNEYITCKPENQQQLIDALYAYIIEKKLCNGWNK